MDSESRVLNNSPTLSRSESKVIVGQKREIADSEGTPESSHKIVKLSDLKSVRFSKAQGEIQGRDTKRRDVNFDSGALYLNANAGPHDIMGGVNDPACFERSDKLIPSVKLEKERVFDLDLNAEDVLKNDPFHQYKNHEHLKMRDDSECGSSVGSLDEHDSVRVWERLKPDNYMSISYGAMPISIPKSRGRKKSNSDIMKKMDLAKQEQVDQFANVAKPTGLLNGLNPGIIYHVRNSRQVHSIIDAIVRSEKTENQLFGKKQGNQIMSNTLEPYERSGILPGNVVMENRQLGVHASLAKSNYLKSEFTSTDDDSYMQNAIAFEKVPSNYRENKDNRASLQLSPLVKAASESTSCMSNDESGNFTGVASLSVKAANIASQWLELLNHDIDGRLSALRCSKKRVQAVITKELPFLMSSEFSSNLDNDIAMTRAPTCCQFDKAFADAHAVWWSNMFGQMDIALSEEESHLESWSNQVKEMQLLCDRGISRSCDLLASQESSTIGNNNRLLAAESEKDLAVRAAAASIYSTCNYLLSTGKKMAS